MTVDSFGSQRTCEWDIVKNGNGAGVGVGAEVKVDKDDEKEENWNRNGSESARGKSARSGRKAVIEEN